MILQDESFARCSIEHKNVFKNQKEKEDYLKLMLADVILRLSDIKH